MPIFKMLVGNAVRVLASLTLGAAAVAASAQTVTYFHNDPSGSPLMATDADGAVLWKENYRPYGSKHNNAAGSNANAIGFAGRPYDASSGLSYMDARYYDPVLGRFLGVDPAPVNPESVHGINRYAYANNNPARYVDPDGHTPLDVAFLVWDLGKLSLAVYSGNPAAIADAATDVAMSVVGVASPIPGTGQAMKAARAAEHAVEAARVADRAIGAVGATKGRVLRDAEGASAETLAKSVGGPTAGTRGGQAKVRKELIDEADAAGGTYKCWRCGQTSVNPADMHLGHRNVPTSRGGNLSRDNVCLEGAACNLSAGNRGAPSPGMSCAERGSCGAPYGR